jgi:hypothetical protein
MLISTALLLDSIIRNSVCTPAKLPCRRVEVGYENRNYSIIIAIGTKFEINTQLRMRIVHNWKVQWIFRLFKAIISIYSIIKIH